MIMLIAIGAAGIVFSGMTGREDPSGLETEKIRDAIIGSFETEMQLGKFQSPDGTTASLSEGEISRAVQEYREKVNRYYTKAYFKQDSYDHMNEYYLCEYFKEHIGGCYDGGASDCIFQDINHLSDDRIQVKGSVACWNQWVVGEDDGSFAVQYPIDVIRFESTLVKEGETWKLEDNSYFEPEPVETLDWNTLSEMEVRSRISEERENLIHQKFGSYEEALTALNRLKN